MGTDRSHEYVGPCLCGKGTFEIDYCTPDHSWDVATKEWYEKRIQCPICDAKYELRKFGKKFGLVDKEVIARNAQKSREAGERQRAFMQTPKVQAILQEFAAHLDRHRTKIAAFRELSEAGLEYAGIAKFRDRWINGSVWVNQAHLGTDKLAGVLKLMGKKDAELEAELQQVSTEERQELEVMIEPPVYTLTDLGWEDR